MQRKGEEREVKLIKICYTHVKSIPPQLMKLYIPQMGTNNFFKLKRQRKYFK